MSLWISPQRRLRRLAAASVLSAGLAGLLVGCGNGPVNNPPSSHKRARRRSARPISTEPRCLRGPRRPTCPLEWPAPAWTWVRWAWPSTTTRSCSSSSTARRCPWRPTSVLIRLLAQCQRSTHMRRTGRFTSKPERSANPSLWDNSSPNGGVKLTPTQIGGVQAKAGEKVTITSNGAPVAGDPMDLRLKPDQKIVLRVP